MRSYDITFYCLENTTTGLTFGSVLSKYSITFREDLRACYASGFNQDSLPRITSGLCTSITAAISAILFFKLRQFMTRHVNFLGLEFGLKWRDAFVDVCLQFACGGGTFGIPAIQWVKTI